MKHSTTEKKTCMPEWLHEHLLSIVIILATVLGFGFGLLLRYAEPSDSTIMFIGFPGKLLLRAFFMIIIPLLVCSMILGVSAINIKENVRMVLLTISFFLVLSLFCSVLGAVAMHITGVGSSSEPLSMSEVQLEANETTTTTVSQLGTPAKDIEPAISLVDSLLDLLRNAIPDNIIQAGIMQHYTAIEKVAIQDSLSQAIASSKNTTGALNSSINSNSSTPNYQFKKVLKPTFKANYFGLLIFSVVVGCAISSLGDEVKQLKAVIEQANVVLMKILSFLLRVLPVAIFLWMCQQGLEVKSPGEMFRQVGWLVFVGLLMFILHQFFILPVLYILFVRKNPYRFHSNLLSVIMTAFGTCSSAATLPVTLHCMEMKNRIHRGVTRFVLPLGMVVNMQGGTMYHTMCVIFVASMNGESLSIGKTAIACLTVVLLLIAAPGVPSGGQPVLLLTALAAVGIEASENVVLVVVVDWFMERLRTVNNVVGDCYVAAIVEKLCWDKLSRIPDHHESLSEMSTIEQQPISILVADNVKHANILRETNQSNGESSQHGHSNNTKKSDNNEHEGLSKHDSDKYQEYSV